MKPLVSVVIPVYNIEKYIGECLSSVLKSSYKNLEILVIDDCSLDNGKNIVEEYREKDSRIIFLENQNNEGVCYTRNRGLKKATGKYVVFVDGDDLISEFWIENLVEVIESKECSIVIGKSKNYKDDKIEDYKITDLKTEGYLNFEKMRLNKNGVVWNKIYNLDFLKEKSIYFSDDVLNYGEDLEFIYRALSQAKAIYYAEVGEYYYRCSRPFSLSKEMESKKRVKNLSIILKNLTEFSKKNNIYNRRTLKKISEDILIEKFENPSIDININLIRSVGRFIPEMHKIKMLRKQIKRRIGLK